VATARRAERFQQARLMPLCITALVAFVFSAVGANTFAGLGTWNANNAGDNNSFFGSAAGFANLGSNNSFFGTLAGLSNTTGASNSFFGSGAGQNNSLGGGNSFFGIKSGFANTTGFSNAFFSSNSGQSNVTGAGNAFFGIFSGQANTEGFSNAFFGTNAGFAKTFLFWLGQVNSIPLRDATKQHAMVCAFLTAAEYQQRFSPLVTHTNQECSQ